MRVGLGRTVVGDIDILITSVPFLESPENFSGPKTICESANRLFWKADLLTCLKVTKRKMTVKFDDFKSSPF